MLPFRAIDKHRNDLFQIEAFFYGLAGLLEDSFLKKGQEDEYSLRLIKEFRYLQRKFEFTQVMNATLWRFLRLRPENFPTVRLAQLAYLYQRGGKLFSRLLEAGTLAEVRTLLEVGTSSYWESHYLFGRTSSQKKKTMGERSKDLIIINTVVPFLYTYGLHKADGGEQSYYPFVECGRSSGGQCGGQSGVDTVAERVLRPEKMPVLPFWL